jgi:ABC-2 type transport system permease protein
MRASEALERTRPRRVALGWAFVERQGNLWKRYWGWELAWIVYGVVNTLAITFIAKQAGQDGIASPGAVKNLTLFLLIGTLVWAYLSAVLDDMTLVIMWERWEGTIEHTFMTPVSRVVHLLSMAAFAVVHGVVRITVILCCALPFFNVDLSHTDLLVVIVTIALGSTSLIGLGILTSIMPMLYPERGEQLSFMVQALVLLLSGVYYGINVLPGWLQAVAHLSPATYMLRGIRAGVIDGSGFHAEASTLGWLILFGIVMVPGSIFAFTCAERWAKRTGRLKRQG